MCPPTIWTGLHDFFPTINGYLLTATSCIKGFVILDWVKKIKKLIKLKKLKK